MGGEEEEGEEEKEEEEEKGERLIRDKEKERERERGRGREEVKMFYAFKSATAVRREFRRHRLALHLLCVSALYSWSPSVFSRRVDGSHTLLCLHNLIVKKQTRVKLPDMGKENERQVVKLFTFIRASGRRRRRWVQQVLRVPVPLSGNAMRLPHKFGEQKTAVPRMYVPQLKEAVTPGPSLHQHQTWSGTGSSLHTVHGL
ncbi:hypothetical protein H920_01051 [Fukomys damarensis]|uniref:Uncharacterized protein n=1 Tax=Fukomys damarensis TaxID=885580 RepID=A0A091EPF4_FUKDA|nr:hypothetical protein H920_01051 [Fukomys damarensis]